MKANRNKGNFLSLLVANYVIFTVSLVAMLFFLYMIFAMFAENILAGPTVKELADTLKERSPGEYENINAQDFLGNEGYFSIVDNNENTIYQSYKPEGNISYTKGELSCIPDCFKGSYVTTQVYYSKTNKKFVAVSVNSTEAKDNTPSDMMIVLESGSEGAEKIENNSNAEYNELYILDENLNIIYSTKDRKRNSFTEKEFKYLTGTFSKKYDIQKHKFEGADQKTYTMVAYTEKLDEKFISHKLFKLFVTFLIILLVSYLILIAVFIAWMNKKIKKPLVILNNAIVNFSVENCEKPLEYKGSKEFVDICDSFNYMSEQLLDSERKRRVLEQSKQKMLADISHDLKTPITVIRGYSKAICDGLISEEEKNQYLSVIYKKSDNLSMLIDTFFEYSIVEHPNFDLKRESWDICEFAREYLAEKYNEIYLSGFSLVLDIPEKTIMYSFDKLQLKRVFENIMGNTMKHNDDNTELFFSIEDYPDCIKIVIGDDGVGIAQELSGSIFEPFRVGDEARGKKYGSGLGLAICKKIIELHNGKIRLISKAENLIGTQFEITLPKCKGEECEKE